MGEGETTYHHSIGVTLLCVCVCVCVCVQELADGCDQVRDGVLKGLELSERARCVCVCNSSLRTVSEMYCHCCRVGFGKTSDKEQKLRQKVLLL